MIAKSELLARLKHHRQRERESTVEILKILLEVENRGIHLEMGYDSIYAFCMKELDYREDEAYTRVQAMRCMKAVPIVQEKIESGELSLTVVARAQATFRRQAKMVKALPVADKVAVIESLVGSSVRQAERKLAAQFPEAQVSVEKIKPISESRIRMELSCSNELIGKLEKLKHLLAHKNFDGRMEGVLEAIADIALEKLDPERKKVKLDSSSEPPKTPTQSNLKCDDRAASVAQRSLAKTPSKSHGTKSRYVSAESRRKAWIRANARCEFKSKTGKRCEGRHGLQIDHIISHSRNGSNEFLNLQLLCGAHNRWKYEREARKS